MRPRAEAVADVNSDVPQIRRSKMILTRRVFTWSLAQRNTNTRPIISKSPTVQQPNMQKSSFASASTSDPIPIESALSENEPVPTFIFQRSIVSFMKRRSGDPPCRYLELSYGLVEPFSPGTHNCSNPRATGMLKRWYQNANRWKVLHKDFRPPLRLEASRRFGGKAEVEAATSQQSPGLSPLLVDAKWSRALGRAPRIIAIGDVHGCISELQELLRLADYQPGDQVILLGDLVAKGPDSVGVVQLAREIGARTVRGNHDFEVVRWWEAQLRGDRHAMVSMEHARIARALGQDEHAWLVDSPWFIECAEMGHLFVHAGFIPGVKLTQQNPRLMMNMRSVLQDGTVTAKNVADCEWAKLWRGPQTVVFGHDAFRGLQLYPFAKGIDTGCVYGGRLTALLLPENRMISVAAKRAYISPKRFRAQKE